MSYSTKSLLVMLAAFVIATIAGVLAAGALAFTVFGAYAPDGLTLMGYVYGLTDREGIACVIAMVATMIAAMVATTTVGERVIA